MGQHTFGGYGDDKEQMADLYIINENRPCPLCGKQGVVTVCNWGDRYMATFNCLRQFNDGFHNLQIGCEGSSVTAARAGLYDKIRDYAALPVMWEVD